MADREASVRVTLDNSQFIVSIKRTGDETDKLGQKGKKTGTLLSDAFKGAKGAISDLGRSIGGAVKLAATFGGAFTLGGALKDALALQASYRTLAFRVQTATGQMVKAADVQGITERAASKTTRTTEEMTKAFDDLFSATGDLSFSSTMLERVGVTATATGESMDSLTTLADQLHTKFGLTADEMDGAFARIFEHAQRGGPKFAEFAEVASAMGANLLQAGLRGEQGLDFLLGALVATDDEFGDLGKQVSGINKLLLNLGKGSELKAIAKSLGIDPAKLVNEKDAIARIMKILSFGKKGLAALKANFVGPEEQKALRILFTDPFEKALGGSGLKGQAAIDHALKVLQGQIGQFGEANLTAADLREEATARMNDPEAKLREALNRLKAAFTQPEVITAIDQLSQSLPKLATAMAKFLSFAAEHPVLSAAAAVGGAVAKGAAQDALGGAAGKALWAGAKGLVGQGAGAAAATGGVMAARLPLAGLLAAGKGGMALAGGGVLAAGLAGAAVGTGLGSLAFDGAFQKEGDVMGQLSAARAGAGGRGGEVLRLARLEAAIKAAEDANVGGGITGAVGRLVGPDTRAMGQREIAEAKREAEALRARVAALQAQQRDAAGGGPAGSATAAPTVTLDRGAAAALGAATATSLGGKVLTVRVSNLGELGGRPGGSSGGASRGPARAADARPGGGY